MIELLLQERGDANVQDGLGNTALHLAAQLGMSVSGAVLLRHGADVNIRNRNGRTPYMTALDYNQEGMANDFRKQMLPWEDIEAVIGKKRIGIYREGLYE